MSHFHKLIQDSPENNDILLGRGGNNNKHPGNEQLRLKAMNHVQEYMASSRTEKTHMVNELVTWVRNLKPPGRFLQKNLDDNNKWYEMDDKIARLKASQVYRDTVAIIRGTKGRVTSDSHRRSSTGTMDSSYRDGFDEDEANLAHDDPDDPLFSHFEDDKDELKSMFNRDEFDLDGFSFPPFRIAEDLFCDDLDTNSDTASDMCCDPFDADNLHSIREDVKATGVAPPQSMDPPTKTKHVIMEQINDARLPISESSEQLDLSRNVESSLSDGISVQCCQINGSIKEKTTIEPSILCNDLTRTQISMPSNLTSDIHSRPHMLNSPPSQSDSALSGFHPNQLEQSSSLYVTERSYYENNQSMPASHPASGYQVNPSFHIGQNRFTYESQNAFDIHSQQLTHSRYASILTQSGAANHAAQDQYYGSHPQTGHMQGNSNASETRAYLDELLNNYQLQHSQQQVSHHVASSTATTRNPFSSNEYIAPLPSSQLDMKTKSATAAQSTVAWFSRNNKGNGRTQGNSSDAIHTSFSEVLKNYQMSMLLDQLLQLPQEVPRHSPSVSSPSMISTRTDLSSGITSSALSSVSSGQQEAYTSFRNRAANITKISSSQRQKSGSRSFSVYQSYRRLLEETESGKHGRKRKSSRK